MADPKPKARRVAAKKVPEPPDKRPQRERFIEAAREAGVTDEKLDEALERLVPGKGGKH